MKQLISVVSLFAYIFVTGCSQNGSSILVLFDPGDTDSGIIRSLTGDRITLDDAGVLVEFADDLATATIEFAPVEGHWDASDFRFIRCEIENLGPVSQLVELGFGEYDLTQGATIIPPGDKKSLKAVIYRTEHPDYIDRLFPVMHGKPDGVLRGWMATTFDSIAFVKLLFPELNSGSLRSYWKDMVGGAL